MAYVLGQERKAELKRIKREVQYLDMQIEELEEKQDRLLEPIRRAAINGDDVTSNYWLDMDQPDADERYV